MIRNSVLVAAMVLCAAGCSKDSAADSKGAAPTATKADEKPVTTAAPKPSAAPTADKPAEVAGGVPDIPETQSKPPSVAEWATGKEVNTVGPNSAAKDCTMKIVREWLKINCTGKIVDATMMEGFGKDGFDYFQSVKPGTMADFVVRVKKGGALKLRINREKDRASLFMNWPSGSPKPTIIALQHMAL